MLVCGIVMSAATTNVSLASEESSAGSGKAWVDDFASFANAPAGKRWVVGRSNIPCLSEGEAFEAACRDARDQLYVRVRSRLGPSRDRQSEEWMKGRIAQELLANGELITDRFVSRVHRPYAEIWSESILVDASSKRLSALLREHAQWVEARRRAQRGAMASIGGMSLAILLVYAVLNALTKGYFRGRLRAGAALTLAAVVIGAVYAFHGAG
jgi:hypothetical protein